jgi:hypothetical protein
VPYGLQIGVGVDRSFAVYIGEPAGGAGYDPDLPQPRRDRPPEPGVRVHWPTTHQHQLGHTAALLDAVDESRGDEPVSSDRHLRNSPSKLPSRTCTSCSAATSPISTAYTNSAAGAWTPTVTCRIFATGIAVVGGEVRAEAGQDKSGEGEAARAFLARAHGGRLGWLHTEHPIGFVDNDWGVGHV